MYKVGETYTPQKVTIEEGKIKARLFLIQADESIYGKLLEDMRKADFLGNNEYFEMINGAYE